jgi:hypothetical protein
LNHSREALNKRFVWILVVALGVSGYAIGMERLRQRLEGEFSRASGQAVKIQRAGWVFPVGVRLTGLTLFLERTPEGISGFPSGSGPGGPFLPFGRLQVRGAQVRLVDKKVSPETAWVFRKVRADLRSFGKSQRLIFRGWAELEGDSRRKVGEVSFSGERLPAGMVQAKVELQHNDLRQLSPYLTEILGVPPTAGTAALECSITSQGETLIAANNLTAQAVAFQSEKPTVLGIPGGRLVELLKDSEGKIRLNFLVTGRQGQKLDWSGLASAALAQSLRQAMARSIHRVLTDTEEVKPLEEKLHQGLESVGR